MQLTQFTDLSLRVLMYVAQPERHSPQGTAKKAITIPEIAERFDVSRNHLAKAVNFMASQHWLVTTRGKGGGIALMHPPEHYNIGTLVRTLEGKTQLVDCANPPCVLRAHCGLKSILDEALEALFCSLDQYTLASIIQGKTRELLVDLQRIQTLQIDAMED